MFNKITRNKIATTRNISNNKKATNNKIKTTRNKIKSNWLWLDASPTLVDKANGVSRWSLNLVRISQWSQLHLHIAVVAVVLSILLRHCCRHLKFVEVLDSVDATSDLWLAPQSIADNKGSSRSCRQDPVLGESPDNHDDRLVVRVMMTMMMSKSKYWSPPRAQHYQRSACQKADLVRTTYECSTRSPPWLCTHSRWTDSDNLKSFDNCNVLFFLSKTGSSCRQMNEDGTCPREFFILYLFWVSKPTPITPAMASNASIWFKMVTSSAARQWQVELEMAMLWTQTFCLMMSWSMRARYSRPGGQSTGTRFWETCRKNWCAGINKAA